MRTPMPCISTRSASSSRAKAGNLTLATGLKIKRDGEINIIKGLYALCPYIPGEWPLPQYPSSVENNGILLELHNNRGAMSYAIESFRARNPLAWLAFAEAEDVNGLPPTVISVNECDPLRDEGINFYRLLMHGGVRARCRQVMGMIHATEIFRSRVPKSVRTPRLTSRIFVSADRRVCSLRRGSSTLSQTVAPPLP
jgi:acetyl esterase/lipase